MFYTIDAAERISPAETGAIDIVVPYTTPELTAAALHAARLLSVGLDAALRVVKIQVAPFPLEFDEPPVQTDFLENQLASFCAREGVNARCEVRVAREFTAALREIMQQHSVLVMATAKRPWRTRTERLVARLRKAGCDVVLITA